VTSAARPNLELREIRASDTEVVVDLMAEFEVSAGGLATRAMYRALCQDAVAGSGGVCVVASYDRRVSGFAMGLIDRRRYWSGFLARHPAVGASALWRVASRRLAKIRQSRRPFRSTSFVRPRAWRESSPRIGKIIYVGVSPPFRRSGIATALYRELESQFARRGVRRIDSLIDPDNAASIRLHEATGWTLHRTGSGVYGVRQVPAAVPAT